MKKIIVLSIAFSCLNAAANAQATSSANQNTALSLANAIDITFTGTGTSTGSAVAIPFSTVSDYTNGVQTAAQEMKIRSNKPFTVAVNTNSANFTYAGSTTPAPVMAVSNVLSCMVSSNSTGGTIASWFTGFYAMSATAQTIITNGSAGGDQRFACMYKATPGYNFPAGSYTTNVIFTATQP